KLQKEEKEFSKLENNYKIKRNQRRLERYRLLVTEQTNKECRHCFKKHEIENCEKRRIEWQNKIFECGCDQNMVKRRSSRNGVPTSISFKLKHTYHCCGCKTNFERNDLQEIITQEGNTLLYFKNCRYNFAEQLPKGSNQKEEIMDQHFFCNLEEKYAYKAWINTTYNEHMYLETRLHHYCFSNKSAGSFYDLNLTKMIKIINYLRGVTSIDKALEETDNDVYTQYSREEDFEEIILQCLEFPDQEEHVELTKQKIEEFRKKAEAQGLFNISTNKGKELWKEPIKNTRYCNRECNSIFSEDNHIYFETNNQEAYCEYCYFTE
ncbi:18229_t:CDS:2, partial [Gigaspora rosea]